MQKYNIDEKTIAEFALPAKGKRAYYYDEIIPGFGVAVTDKGTKTFIYYRKINGSPKRITLGRFPEISVALARQKAREAGNSLRTGIVIPPAAAVKQPAGLTTTTFTKLPISTVQITRIPRATIIHAGLGAAILMVFCLLIYGIYSGIYNYWSSGQALQSVIASAIDTHLNHRETALTSANPFEVKQVLEHAIPFEVEIPRIEPGFKLVGGRAYKIGTNSVAFTLWKGKNDNSYSLLQFRLVDFGVKPDEKPELIWPQNMAVRHTPCQALYWSKDDFGYILVADNSELLHGVKPEAGLVNTIQSK